jgi:hypothetical protein
VNQDGILDAVVSSSEPNGPVVFLAGTGDCLRREGELPVTGRVLGMRLEESGGNDSLDLDLLVAPLLGASVSLARFHLSSDGQFQLLGSTSEELPERPQTAMLRDLDGDGLWDILYLSTGGSLSFLRAQPKGGFAHSLVSEGPREAVGMLADDITGDGRLDVAVLSDRDPVSVLEVFAGSAGGDFLSSREMPLGMDRAGSVSFGRFQGAERSALVTRRDSNLAGVFPWSSAGAAAPLTIPLHLPLDEVAGHGQEPEGEMGLAARAGSTVAILTPDGDGGFEYLSKWDLPATFLPVLDMLFLNCDGEGGKDLVFTWRRNLSRGGLVLGYLDEGGGLLESPSFAIYDHPGALAVGELDEDGLDDVALSDESSPEIFVLFGSSTRLGRTATVSLESEPTAIEVADVDGDGGLDLVAATRSGLSILPGDGTGGFHGALALPGAGSASIVRAADIDADGGVEIVSTVGDKILIRRGVLEDPGSVETIALGSQVEEMELQDLDGDSRPEIVVLESRGLSVLRSRRSGGFQPPERYLLGPDPSRGLVLGDADGDGVLDCVTGDKAWQSLVILKGTGARAPAIFRRGDADVNGKVDITDAISILSRLFTGGAQLKCEDAGDADDNGAVNISDAIQVLQYLFLSGPEPAAPGPATCGEDSTDDGLSECSHPACT